MSIATLADTLEAFIAEHGLDSVDCAGSSLGARMVLELARREKVGATVALDPGGFWNRREHRVFGASIANTRQTTFKLRDTRSHRPRRARRVMR